MSIHEYHFKTYFKFNLIVICFFISTTCYSQNQYKIQGIITEENTTNKLIGANIYNVNNKKGSSTNINGRYIIDATNGLNTLIFSFIGYKTDTIEINIKSDTIINRMLKKEFNNLSEIKLKSNSSSVKSIQSSVIQLEVDKVNKLPSLFGETDILKSIQLLPGIQSGSEGSTGFYVRGGGPDQNLILIDGIPIYNSSHLLGFFSIFNNDIIENITLTKGGFPARFGGRLSSVLEINTKNGNLKKWKVNAGIGLISGKITLEGPIIKDKTSIIVSARRTWIDLLKKPIANLLEKNALTDNEENKIEGSYYFYDLNTKINHKISKKSNLYITIYSGEDNFNSKIFEDKTTEWQSRGTPYQTKSYGYTKFGLTWKNLASSARWEFNYNEKLKTITSIFFSSYKFLNNTKSDYDWTEINLNNNDTTYNGYYNSDYLYSCGIYDLSLQIEFNYKLNKNHLIKFGNSITNTTFSPGFQNVFKDAPEHENYPNAKLDTTILFLRKAKSLNTIIYLENIININTKLSTNIGVHYNLYQINKSNYNSFQPRLSTRYLINKNSSVKISYAKMNQNIHLLTNSTIGLPNDIWVPSTSFVKPQKSNQFGLGYYININNGQFGKWLDFNKHNFEFSIELYMKKMKNLISYSEGNSIFESGFSQWEDRVELNGKGETKGVEFLLQKNTGKWTGWIGYTLSKSTRKFQNINLGNEYPYKFDRRHDLSFINNYKIKKNIILTSTFVYGTGNSINIPSDQYLIPSHNGFIQILNYNSRNSYQIKPYHRLDIGCSFIKQKTWGERSWIISIYNIYNRKNPFFIFFENQSISENNLGINKLKPSQVSLFPIIPSIRYNLKF